MRYQNSIGLILNFGHKGHGEDTETTERINFSLWSLCLLRALCGLILKFLFKLNLPTDKTTKTNSYTKFIS
jgi:hypothetical protein